MCSYKKQQMIEELKLLVEESYREGVADGKSLIGSKAPLYERTDVYDRLQETLDPKDKIERVVIGLKGSEYLVMLVKGKITSVRQDGVLVIGLVVEELQKIYTLGI